MSPLQYELCIIVVHYLKQLINTIILSHYRSLYLDYHGYSGHLSSILGKICPPKSFLVVISKWNFSFKIDARHLIFWHSYLRVVIFRLSYQIFEFLIFGHFMAIFGFFWSIFCDFFPKKTIKWSKIKKSKIW